MFITLCWDVLHSSHQICMEKIKLTSVKFKFSKTSQQESNPSAINAISDRLFFLARSSCPPPLLYMSRGQMPTGLYLWPTLGSIYYLDARFDFYFSSLRKTRLPNSQLFNCLCDTFPQVFSVVAQRTSPCGEERCVTRLKTAV